MRAHMAENRSWLHKRWLALAASLAANRDAADATWDALVSHYCEPHRAYHNLSHVMALLRLADAERGHIERPEVVGLAIWFHDVIYDTHAKDNELRSAVWARNAMQRMQMDPELIPLVEQCILATQKHEVPTPHPADLPLFLDLDLAILGADEEIYQRYSQAIRTEYGWVPDPAYRSGRTELLKRFLARPALFFTPAMAARFEDRARRNIARELRQLGSSQGI